MDLVEWRCDAMRWAGLGWAELTGEGRNGSSKTRSRASGHEHLQLQTSHYCSGPQVEQTEWRNGGIRGGGRQRCDAMQCIMEHLDWPAAPLKSPPSHSSAGAIWYMGVCPLSIMVRCHGIYHARRTTAKYSRRFWSAWEHKRCRMSGRSGQPSRAARCGRERRRQVAYLGTV